MLEQAAARSDSSGFLLRIEQAMESLLMERRKGRIAGGRVTGGLVEIYDLENLAIISDLHGDSRTFFNMLGEIKYEQFLANTRNKLVFLGDYVDRGPNSIDILYSICYLKYTYPDSVVLMRGNHEAPTEFPFASHDLPYRIEDRFGIDGKSIYSRILSLFKLLTLSTIIQQKLLLVHGGLPTDDVAIKNYREAIATAQENNIRSRVLEELLWNDPRNIDGPICWEASRRGFGRHFGSGVSQRWLGVTGTKVVVRGHEPCQGFRIDHDGLVLTLFSCKIPYPLFKAAFVLSSADQLDTINGARDLSHFIRLQESP